MEQAVVND